MMANLTPQDKKLIEDFVKHTMGEDAFNSDVKTRDQKIDTATQAYIKAKEYEIDPILFLSLIHQESSLGTKANINVAQVFSYPVQEYNAANNANIEYPFKNPEDSLEVGAWYLKEQLTEYLGGEFFGKWANKEAPKEIKEFQDTIKNYLGVQTNDLKELSEVFKTELKNNLKNPTNEYLTAIAIGAYNEGANGLAETQISEGNWALSKRANSDPDTAWDFASKITNRATTFAQEYQYPISINPLPLEPQDLSYLTQKQPKVTTELPPLADLGFTGITPEAAPLTNPEPLETSQVASEIPQVTPEVAQEERFPQRSPK